MALELRVNGRRFDSAEAITVQRSLEQAVGTFTVDYAIAPDGTSMIKGNDPIQIYADGVQVLNGFAERISGYKDAGRRIVSIAGRDVTADFLDSSVRNTKDFNGPISLTSIAQQVISDLGLSISVVDNSTDLQDFLAEDLLSASPGEKAYDFVERIARKRQVIVTTDGEGNLEFLGGDPVSTNLVLISNDQAGAFNNLISLSFDLDFTKIYGEIEGRSQLNPLRQTDATSTQQIVTNSGSAQDPRARANRYLELITEDDAEPETVTARAEYEAAIRRSESLNVMAVMPGHTDIQSGNVPFPGRSVRVIDEVFGVDMQGVIRSTDMTWTPDTSNTAIVIGPQEGYGKQISSSGSGSGGGQAVEVGEFIRS